MANSAVAGIFNVRAAHASPLPIPLIVERRVIEVNGKPASVYGIRQPDGTPGVVLGPNQRFQVLLQNRIAEPTIVHWHGQTPPAEQDGVTDTGVATLIPPGGDRTYDFVARPGTHWMHSHHGLQEQLLLAAPLIVGMAEDVSFDAQEVTVLLHDFSFRDPRELLGDLTGNASGDSMMAMPGMDHPMGAPHAGMDLNDVEYDAYLANDRTLGDPLVVRTERNGRVRVRLINGATTTAFWIDLGTIKASVIAVDGDRVRAVEGSRFPLAPGQRLDLLLTMPASGGAVPLLAQREGDRARTGFILATPGATVSRVAKQADVASNATGWSLEERLVAWSPLTARPADVTHRIVLGGQMMPYAWSIDQRTWTKHRPLPVRTGQRVVIDMINRSAMAHPMHLHGHHFQVVRLNGKPIHGAMRDTVLVPVKGSVRIAFDAGAPGRSLLHCHNLFHMATGMMTEIVCSL